jgi:hypothetical protein
VSIKIAPNIRGHHTAACMADFRRMFVLVSLLSNGGRLQHLWQISACVMLAVCSTACGGKAATASESSGGGDSGGVVTSGGYATIGGSPNFGGTNGLGGITSASSSCVPTGTVNDGSLLLTAAIDAGKQACACAAPTSLITVVVSSYGSGVTNCFQEISCDAGYTPDPCSDCPTSADVYSHKFDACSRFGLSCTYQGDPTSPPLVYRCEPTDAGAGKWNLCLTCS